MQANSPLIRVLTAWLLALLLAVAVGALTIFLVNSRVFGPEQQIRHYFEALKDGSGEEALGILNAPAPKANPSMLDGPALRSAAASIDNLEVGDPEASGGNRVIVPVTYTVDNVEANSSYILENTGTRWLFFDTWTFVAAPLPTMQLSVINQNTATLNGTTVAMPEGQNSFAVFYPGKYESHYTSEYFAAPAQSTVVATRQDKDRIALATRATDKLRDDVGQQVKKFLDECALQKVLQPAGCPFAFDTENRIVGNIKWNITEYPEIVIEPNDGNWIMRPLSGTALLTTTQQDLFTGQIIPLTIESHFSFTARLDVTDSNITVTPVVEY
ncbi:hypothetical protein [Arthrobacter roseus]|uniref:hypothetical protein n=1 Tax=Arthrobacter roseus TaxID=136274 RepID=UPI0030846922|nr:hypothetical protein [Arthrobacter roseus]